MNKLIDTQLGQYQLKEEIRRGGMSTVYKAYQPSLDRYVAVKVLAHTSDSQFAERFKREARAIAQLQHPNILPIYDYGEQDGLLYLVMRYVENGITLGDMLGKPMGAANALRQIRHVLDALDYAHKRNIIHRDIKPANVLMPSPTWPMLADFGIAKLLNSADQRLTMQGMIVGTVAYMAPEQATGSAVDARTDIYATGVMLYEMVTGRVPFEADTPMAVLSQHAYEPPPPPRSFRPDLSPLVETVLLRAMAKDPNARFQSAADMAQELDRVANLLDQPHMVTQESDLYAAGMRAFEDGQWDQAVEYFSRLVAQAPAHEDAADLLEAASAARERARAEARQQIEIVRQRQSTTHQPAHPRPATTPTPPRPGTTPASQPAPTGTASNTPATRQPEPAPRGPTVVAPTGAGAATSTPVRPATLPSAEPAPAAGSRRIWPWAVGAVLALVVVGVVYFVINGTPQIGGGATAVATITATEPAAATSGPVAVATAAPQTDPTSEPPTSEPPTSEPPPAPIGQLVFQEDFSDITGQAARTGLEEDLQNNEFSRGVHPPGGYHFLLHQQNDTRAVLLPRVAYGDFSMQLELWDNSDDRTGEVAYGVVARARDDTHFYTVLIDTRKGQYTIRKQDGQDNWTDLKGWTPSPAIKQADQHNLLRLDGQGSDFSIYLNDTLLDSFSDDTFPYGMVGMIVANGDAAQPHIHFDNIMIWSSDQPAVEAELPPERETPAGQMVLIPGGEFIMGSTQRSEDRAHMVYLDRFYIDRSEVTNEAYQRCVEAGACEPPSDVSSISHPTYFTDPQFATFPVIHVSWEQARGFCGWAEKRLPTEAEWEKAASWHAETSRKSLWPWGNVFDPARINSDESGQGDATAVGVFGAELNNTVDMGGNVSEWTSSLLQPYPYSADDGREDQEAEGDRVFRGGSWAQTKGKATTVFREGSAPSNQFREIGFRCADDP